MLDSGISWGWDIYPCLTSRPHSDYLKCSEISSSFSFFWDNFLTKRAKLLYCEIAIPILYFRGENEQSLIFHKWNQHILEIWLLSSFVQSSFLGIRCNILAPSRASNVQDRKLRDRKCWLSASSALSSCISARDGAPQSSLGGTGNQSSTWDLQPFIWAWRAWVFICLLCFKPQSRQFSENEVGKNIHWYSIT